MFLNEKHHFSLLSQAGANNVPIYKALELYINFNYFTTKCEHSSTNLGYLHQEVTYRPGAAEGTRDLRAWQKQIHKSCFGEVVIKFYHTMALELLQGTPPSTRGI